MLENYMFTDDKLASFCINKETNVVPKMKEKEKEKENI